MGGLPIGLTARGIMEKPLDISTLGEERGGGVGARVADGDGGVCGIVIGEVPWVKGKGECGDTIEGDMVED